MKPNFPEFVTENTELRRFTSFRIGGPAAWYYEMRNPVELAQCLKVALDEGLPVFFLGKGSNLVISDKGWPGLIVHFGKQWSQISPHPESPHVLQAQSGAMLSSLVNQSIKLGLAGMETMAGIPGTVGGGVRMNAGAFGQEIKDTCIEVQILHADGTQQNIPASECDFSYRHSRFCSEDSVILGASFQYQSGDDKDLQQISTETLKKRKNKQPVELPNAGSMFKRPPGNYAGTLIESAGLKGLQVGDAQVSTKHANFLVNLGNASAQDVWDLSQLVIQKVEDQSGIRLEREVIFLGEFNNQ